MTRTNIDLLLESMSRQIDLVKADERLYRAFCDTDLTRVHSRLKELRIEQHSLETNGFMTLIYKVNVDLYVLYMNTPTWFELSMSI